MNKISEKKVNELINELNELSSFKDSKRKTHYWYTQKQNVVNSENIPTDLIKEFLDAYNNVKKNTKESVETDDRAVTEVERDENGRITYYTFEIFRKDSPTLKGKLNRNEMETIYRLYSIYGSNLTQKIVSREFPEYTFVEFKRILRAFNIYKANSEFAPHIIEERTEEELVNLHNQNKENNVLRKIEKDQLSEANKLINKLAQENQNLKKTSSLFDELLKYNPNFENVKPNIQEDEESESSSLVIFLSDLHIGAYNEKYGFYQLPNYDKDEITRRLDVILNKFLGHGYKNIIVIDLGDSIDQYNKETTRGGHMLPNNMTDKEMSHLYLDCMTYFFAKLKNYTFGENYIYLSIGESNHSGNFGWALNLALSYKLQQNGWLTYVSDYPIDHFDVEGCRFIYTHGKDNYNQSKQFPLTLNPQTELYFTNYIVENNLNLDDKRIFVVKGDLHRYAYTSGKQFDYVSVGSMYATSNYIAANFGNTPWSINYAKIFKDDVMFGKISD